MCSGAALGVDEGVEHLRAEIRDRVPAEQEREVDGGLQLAPAGTSPAAAIPWVRAASCLWDSRTAKRISCTVFWSS
jgi:hypothetical protein